MATVFNGNTLTITLDAPTTGVLDLDVQRLYSEWKEWMLASFQNMGYPPAFRVVGGDDLTPGIKSGAYYFLRNDLGWRIKSTEEDQTIYLAGNLAPQDSTLETVIPTTGDFTVAYIGLQPVTQNVSDVLEIVQQNQYLGVIYYDAAAAISGSARPFGTSGFPVNNETDLLAVAARENINVVRVQGSLTLTQSYDGWVFLGDNNDTDIVSMNGQSVEGAAFKDLRLSGAGSGAATCTACNFDNVSGIGGTWYRVGILNTLTLSTTPTLAMHSFSGIAGTGRPVIDANSVAVDAAFRDWVGGFELRNLSNAGANVTVDGDPIRLLIAASCTNSATLVVGGEGDLVNNGTIQPSIDAFLSKPLIATEVLESTIESTFTLQEVLRLLAAAAAGTIEQQTNGTYTIRGIDGTTGRILGALATNNGRTITSRDVG